MYMKTNDTANTPKWIKEQIAITIPSGLLDLKKYRRLPIRRINTGIEYKALNIIECSIVVFPYREVNAIGLSC
jgi:hypothetical protein